MRTTVMTVDARYEKVLEVAAHDIGKTDIFREAIRTFVRPNSQTPCIPSCHCA